MKQLVLSFVFWGMAVVAGAQMMAPVEIDGLGRVTFRVDAGDVGSVQVVGKGNGNGLGTTPIDLAKGSGGEWKVTTGPIRPGFHYYDVLVDGAAATDLRNHVYFGWGRWTSGLEVPDPENRFYEAKAGVPRGEVRFVYYDSQLTGRTRKCLVYTPPGYDAELEGRYPVLFLQHGNGESELAWLEQGKVNFIMDNLIHEGRAEPMLVVMDNGFAARGGSSNWYRPSFAANIFERVLVEEVMPLVESRFRVASGSENRAMAGLSMGGQQSISIVFNNPDTFGSLGVFSGGMGSTGALTAGIATRLNAEMELVWFGAGRQDEYLNSYILPARNAFVNRGVTHEYEEIEGTHEWQVWRKCLYRFASKVFRPRISDTKLQARLHGLNAVVSLPSLEIRFAERVGASVRQSSDLVNWEEAEGEEVSDGEGVSFCHLLTEAEPVFFRLEEESWGATD